MNLNWLIWIVLLVIAFMGFKIMTNASHPATVAESPVAAAPSAPVPETKTPEPVTSMNPEPDHRTHLSVDDENSASNNTPIFK